MDIYQYLSDWKTNAPDNTLNIQGIGEILGLAFNIVLGSALAISMIAIILSGIHFITSKGDPKAVAKARTSLTFSIVAFLLAIGALTIKLIIFNVIGGDYGNLVNETPDF